MLLNYLSLALEFYKETPFLKTISEGGVLNDEREYAKEKALLTTLWSNATFEDFSEPYIFLNNRISYLKDKLFANLVEEKIELGFSEFLNGNLYLEINKSDFNNETPYFISIYLQSENEEIYEFPKVYLGVSDNEACIYAIQGKKILKENMSSFEKK